MADNNPADVDALMNCKYPGTELTVSETMPEKVMSIGENLQIRRFVRFAENTTVGYVHAGGKIGVLVNLAVEGGIDATEIGKNVAMQIAALNPRFWDKSQVTQDVLDEEKKVAAGPDGSNDPKMASKPAQVKEKIVMGKMNKFYEENCLLQHGVRPWRPVLRHRGAVYRRRRQEAGRQREVHECRPLRDRRGHREEAGELRRRGGCPDESGQVSLLIAKEIIHRKIKAQGAFRKGAPCAFLFAFRPW